MTLDNNTFDIEIYCSVCGDNDVEVKYDNYNNCINICCKCGNKDTIIIDD